MNISRHQRYYQKHRDRILNLLKLQRKKTKKLAESWSLAQIFGRILQCLKKLSEPQIIERLFLAILILGCTAFLISESTKTLKAIEGEGAFSKALLTEMVLVGIAMLSASTRRTRCLRNFCLVGISFLTLLNVLGGSLDTFLHEKHIQGAGVSETTLLEASIAKKSVLLDRYISTNRISGAKRIESEISALSNQLIRVRHGLAQEKSEFMLSLGFMITVLLRLVIMAANVMFASQLGELLRRQTAVTRPNLVLVRGMI